MQLSTKRPGAGVIPLYALGAIFLVPLGIGVVTVTSNASHNDDAHQISRDLGNMYAHGMDFSQPENRNIAMSVAEGRGIHLQDGDAVMILSRIRVVQESDCQAKPGISCMNKGYPVVTQRYLIGNSGLRGSSFGTPGKIDPTSGEVSNWLSDPLARAKGFQVGVKPGESTYVSECYVNSPDSSTGVYSRAIF